MTPIEIPGASVTGRPNHRSATHAVVSIAAAILGSLCLIFLIGPVLKLVAVAGGEGIGALGSDRELRRALILTAVTASVATLIGMLIATPVSYLLARRRFPGRAAISALLDLPILIPHPVAGIALLLVLGRESAFGGAALKAGLAIVSTPLGIIAAMLFVSMPLYISAAREAFSRVDERYEAVARTLGDPPWRTFRRITLPLAGRGLLAAAVVMWARAVSEFGAIVILTYNPKVASVLSYDRFTSTGLPGALPVAAALALLALIPLTLLRTLRAGEMETRP